MDIAANLRPYSINGPSGVAWLGVIPAHWEVVPGRACLAEKNVPNDGMVESTVLSLSYGQIVVRPPEKLRGLVPESFETYQIIDPGDIVVRSTDLQNDWNSLRFGLSRQRGIITSAYMCLYTDGMISRDFGHLLLHAYDLKKVFYGLGSGLRQNLSWNDFKYLPCLVPPLSEQNAIVRYLDHVDGRIQRYIEAKERLIALLQEARQATIHRAVTRGLDPDIPLKPSGVEWLGDVPAHWNALPGRACFTQKKVPNIGMQESTVLSLSYGRIVIRPPEKLRGLVPESFETYQIIDPGDIVVRSTDLQNDWNSLRFGLSRHRGIITSAYMCLNSDSVMSSEYGHLLLHAYDLIKIFYGLGSGLRQNLSWADFKYLPCLLPPLSEQVAITDYVNEATAEIDTAINTARHQCRLLQEYRASLIAHVVTGKVDVRGAAAQLPPKAHELESSVP